MEEEEEGIEQQEMGVCEFPFDLSPPQIEAFGIPVHLELPDFMEIGFDIVLNCALHLASLSLDFPWNGGLIRLSLSPSLLSYFHPPKTGRASI